MADDLSGPIVVSTPRKQHGDSALEVEVRSNPSSSSGTLHSGREKDSGVAANGPERSLPEGQQAEGTSTSGILNLNRGASSVEDRKRASQAFLGLDIENYRRDQLRLLEKTEDAVQSLIHRVEVSTRHLHSKVAALLSARGMLSINGVLTYAEQEVFGASCMESEKPAVRWTAELKKNPDFGAYLERRTGTSAADIPALVQRLRDRPVAQERRMDSLAFAIGCDPTFLILSELLSRTEARLLFGICQYLYIPSIIGYRIRRTREVKADLELENGMYPFEGADDVSLTDSPSLLVDTLALDEVLQVSDGSVGDITSNPDACRLFDQESIEWTKAILDAHKNAIPLQRCLLNWSRRISAAHTATLLLKGPLNAVVVMDKYLGRIRLTSGDRFSVLDGTCRRTWERRFHQDGSAAWSVFGDYGLNRKLAEVAVSVYSDALRSDGNESYRLPEEEKKALMIYRTNAQMDDYSVRLMQHICERMHVLWKIV